jgi:sulfur-oxidizing protein SoxX
MFSVSLMAAACGALALAGLLAAPAAVASAIAPDQPLTASAADPARGRAIVVNRQRGMCLLCHSGDFPEMLFQGTIAPSLAGVGSRLRPDELRQRMIDSRVVNPDTIMPPYFSAEGLVRAAGPDVPLLHAQDIEDIVAFLSTLREP